MATTTPTVERIAGRDLRVGDVLIVLGVERRVWRITDANEATKDTVSPYARFAWSGDDWHLTFLPDEGLWIRARNCTTCGDHESTWDVTDRLFREGFSRCPGCLRADIDEDERLADL